MYVLYIVSGIDKRLINTYLLKQNKIEIQSVEDALIFPTTIIAMGIITTTTTRIMATDTDTIVMIIHHHQNHRMLQCIKKQIEEMIT